MDQYCPHCGTSLPSEAKFCNKCGKPLNESPSKTKDSIVIDKAYKGFEKKLQFEELEDDLERLVELKKGLEKIEKTYGTDVCMMPVAVLEKYRKMRAEVGLPTTLPGEQVSKPRIFGKGKYFDTLSEKLLLIGETTSKETGGLLSLAEVLVELKSRGIKATSKDVEKTIKKLEKNGVIPGMKELKSGAKLIEFVDVTLSKDLRAVLDLAEKGWVTLADLISKTNWSKERAERALKELTEANIARYDSSYAGSDIWFFPCFKKKE